MLALFHATRNPTYLDRGTKMLDYLLLTQQVWNNPSLTPMVLGGFTTQNTDSEWSDARQAYAATILLDYFQETGVTEYLERAVAAARSTFAVAPWENWAHTGYIDEPGALTGFHWGTGSAMTSVEMMQPALGSAFIDLASAKGVGFDECTLTEVVVDGASISFDLSSSNKQRTFVVRFRGLKDDQLYKVSWNHSPAVQVQGSKLREQGLLIPPLGAAASAIDAQQRGQAHHA